MAQFKYTSVVAMAEYDILDLIEEKWRHGLRPLRVYDLGHSTR